MRPITFRKLEETKTPSPGELWVRPARPEDRARRTVAQLVCERGLEAGESGDAPIERIVVDAGGNRQPVTSEPELGLVCGNRVVYGVLAAGCLATAPWMLTRRQRIRAVAVSSTA